jgi:hypothetical protein
MISAEYQELIRRQHQETIWGNEKGHRHINDVVDLITRTKSSTLLDFGAGRGGLSNALRPHRLVTVLEYDPGIVGKGKLPDGQVDLVVSCDVLEHVEPQHLDETLDVLFAKAAKGLYLVIACRKAKAHLVDGTNAHLIVESPQWWLNMLWVRSIAEGFRTDRIWAQHGKELRVDFIRPVEK